MIAVTIGQAPLSEVTSDQTLRIIALSLAVETAKTTGEGDTLWRAQQYEQYMSSGDVDVGS